MPKVSLFDRNVRRVSSQWWSVVATVLTVVLLFVEIPKEHRPVGLLVLVIVLALIYATVWIYANKLRRITVNIEGSSVEIKVGDIFKEVGFKVISCNEYFDTQVDDKIIAATSVNGKYLKNHLDVSISELDREICDFSFEPTEVGSVNKEREVGKKQRYRLGTIFVHGDYLLTAFAKFDESNRAVLTMPEYLEFLINFWDRVNKVYAQKSVSVTIFGSGITRIKGHKQISDEELLKIMLWTFRVSEMRFKYPAKLTIVVHENSIGKIDLFEVSSARHGL